MLTDIESAIADQLKILPAISDITAEINIQKRLLDIANRSEWNAGDLSTLDFICKKLEIGGKLYQGYNATGKKLSDTQLLAPEWLTLALLLICKKIQSYVDPASSALKGLNALFKALDTTSDGTNADIKSFANSHWHREEQNFQGKLTRPVLGRIAKQSVTGPLRKIPLTVLFYEGPIARAYLETLKAHGLKPEKIIHLVSKINLISKKPVGKWLPTAIRKKYATILQRNQIHHWPQTYLKKYKKLVRNISSEVETVLGFNSETFYDSQELSELELYSDNVIQLLVTDLNDPHLKRLLETEAQGPVLYTGGGIMPESLLNLEHLKFIHIHPGFLPAMRGADCLLWSSFHYGRPSATSFYMSPGIDTGDIIEAAWLPKIDIALDLARPDYKTLYRLTFSFIDPWVRARLLVELIRNNDDFYNLEATAQEEQDGTTYHFMHDKIKHSALDSLFSPIE